MKKDRILIYGATGYMGRLIAELAAKERPTATILAGRDEARLAEMSELLRLPFRAFLVESPSERQRRVLQQRKSAGTSSSARSIAAPQPNQAVDAALSDVGVLLNAAGPFGDTAVTLARACVRTQTHYLDIGGEYAVFRSLDDLGQEAFDAHVAIMPGVGLSVLGSDLLVRRGVFLARSAGMSQPHSVRVALSRVPFVSRGSARTMLDAVRDGVIVRRNGQLSATPVGHLVRSFDFGIQGDTTGVTTPRRCTSLTLADTHTVGETASRLWREQPEARPVSVPNVETYVEASAIEQATYELASNFALALRAQPIKSLLGRSLAAWPEGPGPHERAQYQQELVVELEDRFRQTLVLRLSMPNSYDFTASAALLVAQRVVEQSSNVRGFVSPAAAFPGAEPVSLPGCRLHVSAFGVDVPRQISSEL